MLQTIKPKRLGLIHKTYQLKHHRFTIGALAFFPLGSDSNELLEEFKPWEKIMTQLPPTQALDTGFAKARGEALMCAQAYWHQHGMFYQSQPGLAVDGIKKHLKLSRFSKSRKNTLLAEFMPQDITSKGRKKYNGSYNKHWQKHIHPGLPEDTDPRLFNAALPDLQRQPGLFQRDFFQPGCRYRLQDVHPEKKFIEGKVPDIRVRMFAKMKPADNNPLQEIPNHLETLWFFPEVNLGLALFRGELQVNDSDGLDVASLLLAYEYKQDEAKPFAHYEEVLALRSDPEKCLAHLFNESQLMPKKSTAEKAAIEQQVAEDKKQHQEKLEAMREHYRQQAQASLSESVTDDVPGMDEIKAALADPTPDPEGDFDIPVPSASVLASGDFDLSESLAAIEAKKKELEKIQQDAHKELMAMADQLQEEHQDELPSQEESPEEIKQRLLNPVYVIAQDLKSQQAESIKTLLDSIPAVVEPYIDMDKDFDSEKLAQAYQQLQDAQKQARQSSPELSVKRVIAPAVQQEVRQWLEQLMEGGESLAGRDYSGMDLSGLDFSQQDLRDAMFEGCNLRGCLFHQANLQGAVFVGATIDDCQFNDCQLQQSNFSNSKGKSVSFKNSRLDRCFMISAKLSGACFDGSSSQQWMATEAILPQSSFKGATIKEANLANAQLDQSHWSQAKVSASIFLQAKLNQSQWPQSELERCILIDIEGEAINFSQAHLDKVQFSNKGHLANADFHQANCHTCGFRGVDMTRLNAENALFIECDFGETQLSFANLAGALFKRCLLSQAQIDQSDCQRVLFNETVIRKVNFNQSNLKKAEIYNCTLAENSLQKINSRKLSVHPQQSIL